MIAIIDYGAGNIRSVVNAFEAIGKKTILTNDPDDLAKASAIILPGVGAFGEGMESLQNLNLIEPLNELILGEKKPYLGICLGMQFLGDESFERGHHHGLGWIKGRVERLAPCSEKHRIPHMGWNNIHYKKVCPLFEGLGETPAYYFVHSFHLEVAEEDADIVVATCSHGMKVTAAVHRGNIFGVQFHPEKSQQAGLKLLQNFVNLI